MNEPADMILHYLALIQGGVVPVTPSPHMPKAGAERAALRALASDARKGEPISRDQIAEVCQGAVDALDRLAYALAGAVMRGDAFAYELQERKP